MLQTGLSHGVAIVPNAPKQRFSDPATGAHFEFDDMCGRLEKLKKKRFQEEMQSSRKSLNKDFKAASKPLSSQSKHKRDGDAEEVLQEDELPRQTRRVQNFVKSPKI